MPNIISIEDTHGLPYFSIAITSRGDVTIRAPAEYCEGEEAVGMPEWVHGTKQEIEAKVEALGVKRKR